VPVACPARCADGGGGILEPGTMRVHQSWRASREDPGHRTQAASRVFEITKSGPALPLEVMDPCVLGTVSVVPGHIETALIMRNDAITFPTHLCHG
jgi:hypothetical protein